jgi:hypothetical protein
MTHLCCSSPKRPTYKVNYVLMIGPSSYCTWLTITDYKCTGVHPTNQILKAQAFCDMALGRGWVISDVWKGRGALILRNKQSKDYLFLKIRTAWFWVSYSRPFASCITETTTTRNRFWLSHWPANLNLSEQLKPKWTIKRVTHTTHTFPYAVIRKFLKFFFKLLIRRLVDSHWSRK